VDCFANVFDNFCILEVSMAEYLASIFGTEKDKYVVRKSVAGVS